VTLLRTIDPDPYLWRLVAHPLTVEAFLPFGEVIECPSQGGLIVNQGRARRFDRALDLSGIDGLGKLTVALYRVDQSTMPLEINVFERHPYSAQLFLPMICERYLVVVAPAEPSGEPAIHMSRAFIAGREQGILYRRNVWHHPIVTMGGVAQFAMLIREADNAADCIEHKLSSPLFCVME
jgi:ureidoglycolate lyase